MKLLKDIENFFEYCNSFYNNIDGIYPIATKKRIGECIEIYLKSRPLNEIGYDSIDREFVRDIIESE